MPDHMYRALSPFLGKRVAPSTNGASIEEIADQIAAVVRGEASEDVS